MTKRRKKILIFTAVSFACVIALLIASLCIRSFSPAASEYITLNFTQGWVRIISAVTSLFPFSLFEVFVMTAIIAVICFIVFVIRSLVKKQFFRVVSSGLAVVTFASALITFYTFTAGLAYNRAAVPVPISEKKYTNEMVIDAATYFVSDFNALAEKLPRDKSGNVISPYSTAVLSEKIGGEFDKLDDDYFFKHTPRGKTMLNSWFMTATNITGITFLPLGEPMINKQIPPSLKPHTMAHEIAHVKGVMREGDCNFIAYYLLANSEDEYLRYCGYYYSFNSFLYAVDSGKSSRENYDKLYKEISPLIKAENENEYKFWSSSGKLNEVMGKIGNFFNDLYLKLSGADNGSGSYGDKTDDGGLTDTGTTDPDTGDVIYDVTYSSTQKMYFYIYEQKNVS